MPHNNLPAGVWMEFYFKARETTVEVTRLRSWIYTGDWITVRGQQAGKDVQLGILKKNGRELHEIWSALVGAGAVPSGPPPQGGFVAANG